MKKKIALLACLMFSYMLAVAGIEPTITTSSELKSVTVYRSGAEMQHIAYAELKAGAGELVINNISNKIDINSIQIKTASAVTILGVEFGNNYLVNSGKSSREKMLEDSLEALENSTEKIERSISNAAELLDVLKANRDIKGSQTGLSVAELTKLMDYYKTKMVELKNEMAQLREKKKKYQDLAEAVRSQIEEEERKNISTAGRLVLQLSVAVQGKYDFEISYIAQNAYWTPFYDVRVENIKNPLKLVYKAKVTQTTGIDWKHVKLSLSTALPSQWGNAPALKLWFLAYVNPVVAIDKKLAQNNTASMLEGKVAGVQTLDEVVVTGYAASKRQVTIRGTSSISQNADPLYVVNGAVMAAADFQKIAASSIKSINVLKDASATSIYGSRGANGVIVVELKDGLEDYVSVADNSMNVTFDIDMPYDVPTNGKEQTAILKNIEVPASYEHYAVPKLDNDAYILAKVKGWEKLNLLPAQANIIYEGTYVGKSFIDPASTQDTLNLTLGKDKRVSIKREKLIDFSSVKFLGSNKQQKITYEITVKNNKNEPVNMVLKDQFPLTTNKEIEVELIDAGSAAINNETGVLNWNISLTTGEVKKVRYTYTVKYPKDKTINL